MHTKKKEKIGPHAYQKICFIPIKMLQNNSVMSYQCVLIFTESSILFTMSLHYVITVWFIIVWMLIYMHILISTICAMAQCPILIVTICAMSQCHSVIYSLSPYVLVSYCHNVTPWRGCLDMWCNDILSDAHIRVQSFFVL